MKGGIVYKTSCKIEKKKGKERKKIRAVATSVGTEAETNRRDSRGPLGIVVMFSVLMEVWMIQEHILAKTQ